MRRSTRWSVRAVREMFPVWSEGGLLGMASTLPRGCPSRGWAWHGRSPGRSRVVSWLAWRWGTHSRGGAWYWTRRGSGRARRGSGRGRGRRSLIGVNSRHQRGVCPLWHSVWGGGRLGVWWARLVLGARGVPATRRLWREVAATSQPLRTTSSSLLSRADTT